MNGQHFLYTVNMYILKSPALEINNKKKKLRDTLLGCDPPVEIKLTYSLLDKTCLTVPTAYTLFQEETQRPIRAATLVELMSVMRMKHNSSDPQKPKSPLAALEAFSVIAAKQLQCDYCTIAYFSCTITQMQTKERLM